MAFKRSAVRSLLISTKEMKKLVLTQVKTSFFILPAFYRLIYIRSAALELCHVPGRQSVPGGGSLTGDAGRGERYFSNTSRLAEGRETPGW